MDYAGRRRRLAEELEVAELEAALFTSDANLHYFTGMPRLRRGEDASPACTVLAVTASGTTHLFSGPGAGARGMPGITQHTIDHPDAFGSAMKNLSVGHRFGVGASDGDWLAEAIRDAFPHAMITDGDPLAESLRRIKDDREIDVLRRAAAVADAVMEDVLGAVAFDVTQRGLREYIRAAGRKHGGAGTSFPPTAGFVQRGAPLESEPLCHPDDAGLRPGTSIAFDFGFIVDAYCSDFGRSLYFGKAPGHVRDAYRALAEAQQHVIETIEPGVTRLDTLFPEMEKQLDLAGYGWALRARLSDGTLGHQIGLDVHENPWIRPGCDDVAMPGMVFCLEPKLWHPGVYYLRIEDMILIGETGTETLTRFPRDRFEVLA